MRRLRRHRRINIRSIEKAKRGHVMGWISEQCILYVY